MIIPKVLFVFESIENLDTSEEINEEINEKINEKIENSNDKYSFKIISNDNNINQILDEYLPEVIVTVGEGKYINLNKLPLHIRKKWIHFSTVDDINTNSIFHCFFHYHLDILNHDREKLVSVFTTTYKSGDKILRPLRSLMKQSYSNWEWVILDDSNDDNETLKMLKERLTDPRIRIYKTEHSGYIGKVKRDAAMLCRGDILVELDHDDDIYAETFEMLINAYKDPDVGFVYSDYSEIYENSLSNFAYGENFSFGYGSYIKDLSEDETRWINVSQTSRINPKNFSYIVGVPNHIRTWRASLYREMGGHNPILHVVDDYELILRTFLTGCKMVRIPKCLYIQYRNTGGNNFTFIRNREIQKFTRWIAFYYKDKIEDEFKRRGIDNFPDNSDSVWKELDLDLLEAKLKSDEIIYNGPVNIPVNIPIDKYLILIIDDINDQMKLREILNSFNNNLNLTKIYIVSNQNWVNVVMEDYKIKNVNWWVLSENNTRQMLKNYALGMMLPLKYDKVLEMMDEGKIEFI